jgi:hypothetical protein
VYQLSREQREQRKPELSIKASFVIRPGYCSRCGLPNRDDDPGKYPEGCSILVLTRDGWIHYECSAEDIERRIQTVKKRF